MYADQSGEFVLLILTSQNVGCILRLGKRLYKTKVHFPLVILLPLRPASLAHKNPQRGKVIYGMRPVGGNQSEHVFL